MAISNDWVQIQDSEVTEDVLQSLVTDTTTNALNALVSMRQSEGFIFNKICYTAFTNDKYYRRH